MFSARRRAAAKRKKLKNLGKSKSTDTEEEEQEEDCGDDGMLYIFNFQTFPKLNLSICITKKGEQKQRWMYENDSGKLLVFDDFLIEIRIFIRKIIFKELFSFREFSIFLNNKIIFNLAEL